MKIRVSKSMFRVLAFTTVIIALSSCGKSANNSTSTTTTTTTTTTGTTGGTGTDTTTGINLYTSICDPSTTCPADEVPFQAKIELDEQLPNGWLAVATVTTGSIGNVILEVPAGNYRLVPASTGNGTATASSVLVTVSTGQFAVASVNFSGKIPTTTTTSN